MPSRYTEITEAQFDGWAHKNEFLAINPETIGLKHTFEKIYAREFVPDKAKIIIFSSIDIRDDTSRDIGKDAIRTFLYLKTNNWFKYADLSRVYRTQNWRDNLTARVKEVVNMVHSSPCPICGNMMLLRDGKYGLFYSCIMWTKTRCPGKAKYND